MNVQRMATHLFLAMCLVGCGGGREAQVAEDAATEDITADSGGEDLAPVEDTVVLPENRTWTYRAIGGVSMGATAFSIHTRKVGTYDFVAALGGYINPIYRQSAVKRHLYGTGCSLETLLAHLDEIDDPDSDALDCGFQPTISPWEFPMDYNHWKADDSGGAWDRDHYLVGNHGLSISFGCRSAGATRLRINNKELC